MSFLTLRAVEGSLSSTNLYPSFIYLPFPRQFIFHPHSATEELKHFKERHPECERLRMLRHERRRGHQVRGGAVEGGARYPQQRDRGRRRDHRRRGGHEPARHRARHGGLRLSAARPAGPSAALRAGDGAEPRGARPHRCPPLATCATTPRCWRWRRRSATTTSTPRRACANRCCPCPSSAARRSACARRGDLKRRGRLRLPPSSSSSSSSSVGRRQLLQQLRLRLRLRLLLLRRRTRWIRTMQMEPVLLCFCFVFFLVLVLFLFSGTTGGSCRRRRR